ncbi:TetR/AcrR family transcriptional regulator [Rhodococcus sp. NM-2]|uniref:TetR/AcrR family transcriptional regulator n=1 Tax=Rhodococcus sp. NM-2 TaxID=3401174 RepID=UPI003AADA07F
MRSGDLRASATIREAALGLFADRGVAGVSIRDVAAAAGVSSSLVMHHFKSKDGLKAAVDARVSTTMIELLAEFGRGAESGASPSSLATAMAEMLDTDPQLPGYLRRLLIDGGPTAHELFRALFDATVDSLSGLEAAGVARPAADPAVRAAFLLVNDLAVILLRDQVQAVLGVDPIRPTGLRRWSQTLMDTYSRGVFVLAPEEERS